MIPLGKQPRLSPFKTKWLSTGCGGLAKGGGFMESRTGVGKPDGHPTCDEISLADGMKTFTFHCGNTVIRLTCNEPSKAAVENFQAALQGILQDDGPRGSSG
jgi:hypothetical protein